MKIPLSFYLFFSFAAIIILISKVQPVQHFFGTEYDIRVINGFSNNSSMPLVIWCSSSEVDLGGRALQERDDYSWKMKAYLWSNNYIKCTMKWDQIRKNFEAFKASRDIYRCGSLKRCSWLVKDDGFYFSNDEINWNKDFSWY